MECVVHGCQEPRVRVPFGSYPLSPWCAEHYSIHRMRAAGFRRLSDKTERRLASARRRTRTARRVT